MWQALEQTDVKKTCPATSAPPPASLLSPTSGGWEKTLGLASNGGKVDGGEGGAVQSGEQEGSAIVTGAHGGGGEGERGGGEANHHILAAFDSTLAAFSKAADFEGTARVVEMLVQAGLQPNASTFNSLIRGGGHSAQTPPSPNSGQIASADGARDEGVRGASREPLRSNGNMPAGGWDGGGRGGGLAVDGGMEVENELLGRMKNAGVTPTAQTRNSILAEQASTKR